MSIAVFNINDAGIQLTVDDELVRTSPGFAVLDKSRLFTGEDAARHLKLLPRWTNNRFWSELNTNPLPNGTDQIRHHADLAFAHLEHLWTPVRSTVDKAIMVVPGYYTSNDLGLLLGMARECGLPVRGVVDHSVIAASNLPLHPTVLHLDAHLHSFTLTQVTNGGVLARKGVKTILDTGLFTFWDRWANIIANQFIQTTRFDPMHNADTEQQLFNLLPGWIAALKDGSMHSLTLNSGQSEHSVAISHENLLKACSSLYPQIVQAIRSEMVAKEPVSLLLSHRVKGFPGLRESLQLVSNLDVIELPEDKANQSATQHMTGIIKDDGPVSHILQLNTGMVTASKEDATNISIPTHILWKNQAIAIGNTLAISKDFTNGPTPGSEPAFILYTRSDQVMMECRAPDAVTVNGTIPDPETPLNQGDLIEIADNQMTLISVLT